MKKQNGFTIIELLVIIAIIGLISSVALANLSQARENARRATSLQQEASIFRAIGDTILGDWKFDEGGGTTAFDTSGNGRDGTISSGTFVTPGANGSGYALYLPGSYSYVKGLGIPSVDDGNVTISAWVKPEISTNERMIFASGYQGCLNYGVALKSGGLANQTSDHDVPLDPEIEGDGSSLIPNNVWTFLVTTFDEDGTSSTYVNGTLAGRYISMPTTNPCGATNWTIGAMSTNATVTSSLYNFQGLIDDLKLYQSVFTASEVQKLYAEESIKIKLADR